MQGWARRWGERGLQGGSAARTRHTTRLLPRCHGMGVGRSWSGEAAAPHTGQGRGCRSAWRGAHLNPPLLIFSARHRCIRPLAAEGQPARQAHRLGPSAIRESTGQASPQLATQAQPCAQPCRFGHAAGRHLTPQSAFHVHTHSHRPPGSTSSQYTAISWEQAAIRAGCRRMSRDWRMVARSSRCRHLGLRQRGRGSPLSAPASAGGGLRGSCFPQGHWLRMLMPTDGGLPQSPAMHFVHTTSPAPALACPLPVRPPAPTSGQRGATAGSGACAPAPAPRPGTASPHPSRTPGGSGGRFGSRRPVGREGGRVCMTGGGGVHMCGCACGGRCRRSEQAIARQADEDAHKASVSASR